MTESSTLPIAFQGEFREAVIGENGHGLGVFADRAFRPGEKIFVFNPVFVSSPDRFTIQVDEGRHLKTESHIGLLLSHSCSPNVRFCSDQLAIFAIKPIRKGEELAFNYLCTEWIMAVPFECRCGSESCHRLISGFKYLSPADQSSLEPHILPHLRKRFTLPTRQL